MPENQIPATQPEPDAAPGEFNFAQPAAENPRIKRRSLKPRPQESADVKIEPIVKITEPAPAPPRVTPSPATTPSRPASGITTPKATPATAASTSGPATSPHGTRPATLYYSSQPRKDKEASLPMKTIPTTNPASSSSASSTGTLPSSLTRSAASSPRPATTIDYRANMERQAREQKSVGNILNYVVYGLIGFFVIGALLAGYGTKVIFDRLNDQSATVSDLDARYAAANKDLNAKLAATQETLIQTQAQITRQQDLIVKQQEELNRLIAATSDNASALRGEKQARAQETASLRAQVRDLENRGTFQKY